MTDVGNIVDFTDPNADSSITQTWGGDTKRDLIVSCKKDIYFKVNSQSSEVARFIYDTTSSVVAVALSGGLRWGTGSPANAAAYYNPGTAKLVIDAGTAPNNAQIALAPGVSPTMELNNADLDLDDNKKVKWGGNAGIYYDGTSKLTIEKGAQITLATGTMELNSADLDVDDNRKVKWGGSADVYYDGTNSKLIVEKASGAQISLAASTIDLKSAANNAQLVLSGATVELNCADLDVDEGKVVKWGTSAQIYYTSSCPGGLRLEQGNGAKMALEGSSLRLEATDLRLDTGNYLYFDGANNNFWIRANGNPAKLEICTHGNALRLGGESTWIEMEKGNCWFFKNFALESLTSDPPTGTFYAGQFIFRIISGECRLYVSNGSNWKYVALTQ